jgi:DNA-binding SARP family transcriptional activator
MIGSLATGRHRAVTVRLSARVPHPRTARGRRRAGPLRLGGPKQRATLAILLLSANRVVSVERLADNLYSGATPVTAVTQVQRQISELRKLLGTSSGIETRSPGYVIRLSPDQLDLYRFERSAEDANQALNRGDAGAAADLLRRALGLWRGTALADLEYEAFAQLAIDRLEEVRLAALEQRIEAELVLGRHAELIPELEELVAEHPLRELLCRQLMLALYRSGRQAEALDVYRSTRAALVEEFGIEPTPALHVLEHAILTQDASLDLGRPAPDAAATPGRAVLVLPSAEDRLDGLLTVAEPLARFPGQELIIGRLLAIEEELSSAASAANARREALQVSARTAVFTTLEPARDVVRLATAYDVDLVLLDASPGLDAHCLPDNLAAILEGSPADVAVLTGNRVELGRGVGVFVPFGGGEHDWAAVELAAWLSSATGAPLRLVGTGADPRRGQRDASRLLADASLAVQRVVGVATEPLLAEPTEGALVKAVENATLVVVGISPRWRQDGIGEARRALVRAARAPILLVHGGIRPGGLAPRGSGTRFTWSIDARSG